MSTSDRAELLRNAVAFLSDPNTQSSTLVQRVQFLEAKGLTAPEIDEALRQASMRQVNVQPSYQPVYNYGPPQYGAPARPPLDWRDYFIMSVVSGSFVYGAVTLAKKFLLPHLRPPTSTAYEEDRDALADQFDAAEKLLQDIQEETAAVRKAVDEQKLAVEQTTQDIDACVKEMRDGEAKTRDEMREIRDEVASIREMLPKMIEKSKESQTMSLSELQQELKSLKALLLSRQPSYPSTPSPSLPGFVGRPSIPSWQLSDGLSNSNDATPSTNGNSSSISDKTETAKSETTASSSSPPVTIT